MEFVTVNTLIKNGAPLGLFWNTADKDRPIEKNRMIAHTLKRGFNERILAVYVDIFGAVAVKKAIDEYKNDLSGRFYTDVCRALKAFT